MLEHDHEGVMTSGGSPRQDLRQVRPTTLPHLEQHALMTVEPGPSRQAVWSNGLDRYARLACAGDQRVQLWVGLGARGDQEPMRRSTGRKRLCHRAAPADPLAHVDGSTLATAYAAIPSPPANPRPSLVVPFTLTELPGSPTNPAIRSSMASRVGAMAGRLATIVRSTESGRSPAARSRSA